MNHEFTITNFNYETEAEENISYYPFDLLDEEFDKFTPQTTEFVEF